MYQMENITETFTETLTELLEDAQINVTQLAQKIHCDSAAVRRWFYRQYLPNPETVIKLTDIFRISADYLFGLSDKKDFLKTCCADTFYARYARLRDGNGCSDYFIAKTLEIRDSAISKWKTIKKFPNMLSLLKLASYFHCSLEYLLGRVAD